MKSIAQMWQLAEASGLTFSQNDRYRLEKQLKETLDWLGEAPMIETLLDSTQATRAFSSLRADCTLSSPKNGN